MAVITPFGLFKFLRMPFGLKNAAQSFQRLMDTVLQGIDFVFIYLDDVLVASANEEDHLAHLEAGFVYFRRMASFSTETNACSEFQRYNSWATEYQPKEWNRSQRKSRR
jgi:hypothetical protein